MNGWIKVTNDAYHAASGIGSTKLWRMLSRSPAHAMIEQEPTEAMHFGSLFHMAILEPEEFQKHVKVAPKCDRRTKEGKATYEGFQLSLGTGDMVCKADDFELLQNMQRSVFASKTFHHYFTNQPGDNELAGFYEDFGMVYKCKPDRRLKSKTIIDVKTTTDASLKNIERSILSQGYALQAAYYLYVANLLSESPSYDEFIWMFVEKEPPYAVAFYRATKEWLEIGSGQLKKAIAIYTNCMQQNLWPAYPDEVIDSVPPAYAFYYE